MILTSKKTTHRSPLAGALFAATGLIAPAVLALGIGATSAAAQGFDDAPALFFDVAIGMEYEDRRNTEGAFEATTRVGLSYFTSTHNQRLSFQTGVTARAGDAGHDLIDPFVTLTYAIFNRDHEISGDLSYRQTEIDLGELEADFDADDLERREGTREDINLGVRLVTGRASPFGTDTELRYAEQNFSNGATDDDTATHTVQSTLRFTVDPRIVLTLTGFWEQKETDDAIDTVDTAHRLTAGAQLAIDRVWTAAAGLGYAEIETRTNFGTVEENGLEGSFLLTRELPNGTLSFSTNHVVTDDGWRNSVRVGRVFNFANGDVLNASVGQIFFEEGGSGHLASLSFNRVVRSGSLSLGFDYSSDLDGTDQMIQRTQLNGSLRQNLTDYSGWSLDGSLASVAYDNPATVDAVRVDLGIAYLHALSNDWDLAARLEHQVLYEDGSVDDRTNVLSLTFERRFSGRP